ncbi:MAG TPA: hypothetical protein VE444_10825 [Gaiellaceae bacterium]|jgi:hypothetical protein|nr:hypothetical protein [Gaiellaceae bacterium]
MQRKTLRRAALVTGALGYIAVGIVHPVPDPDLGDPTGFFVFLHLVQPFLIGLLAYGVWGLVDGIPGRAAKVARFMVVPYALAYTVFETVAGTGMGMMIGVANDLPASDQAEMAALVDGLRDHWLGYPLYFAAGLTWLATAVATAVALGRSAPRHVVLLVGIGGAIFSVAHPQPIGPVGMTLFLAGVVLYWRREREADRVEAPVLLPT